MFKISDSIYNEKNRVAARVEELCSEVEEAVEDANCKIEYEILDGVNDKIRELQEAIEEYNNLCSQGVEEIEERISDLQEGDDEDENAEEIECLHTLQCEWEDEVDEVDEISAYDVTIEVEVPDMNTNDRKLQSFPE